MFAPCATPIRCRLDLGTAELLEQFTLKVSVDFSRLFLLLWQEQTSSGLSLVRNSQVFREGCKSHLSGVSVPR